MADDSPDTSPRTARAGNAGDDVPLTLDTTSALASIGYNTILAQNGATSSEDEASDAPQIPVEEAQSAIGVSISREQTRLSSPQTPAIQKAAVIEKAGGFFGAGDGNHDVLFEEPEEDGQDAGDIADSEDLPTPIAPESRSSEKSEESPDKSPVRLPSPWRVDPKPRWQTGSKARAGLFDGIFNRRRASSGPDSADSWQKSILASLPSLPKGFSMPSPFSTSYDEAKDQFSNKSSSKDSLPPRTESQNHSVSSHSRTSSYRPADNRSSTTLKNAYPPPIAAGNAPHSAQQRAHMLRRSTSDHSLTTLRTLSTVESLGDDSRFEDVSSQVNSRMKAIKDSFQDANIRLPSISVANLTPDFFRERAVSVSKRQSITSSQTSLGSVRDMRTTSSQRPTDPMTRQPYSNAKTAISDATANKTASHPHFNRALEQLEGDLVILGGYRGSILRSADPPHRQLWVPVKVGLNLRKVNLEVGLEEGDDERATDTIIPGGMLTHIGPIDIARRLFKRLRQSENARSGRVRIHDYGYDWRLDPAYLSAQLIKFLESLPCNQPGSKDKRGATVIAHSLGGLITRHAVNKRPDLFKGVVYAGVPYTCVNILGPMRNGDEVLLSDRVLTAQVNFSIRTSFALLPLDGRCFVDKKTREEYRVDFFDPQTWLDYRLTPCLARSLPPLSAPPKPTGITGYVNTMTSALPSFPGRARKSSLRAQNPDDPTADASDNANPPDTDTPPTARTMVTVSRDKALTYLTRTLASVKQFKLDLDHIPAHTTANLYPPVAVIYGKSTPTVYGAKVDGREGIKHADAYDELAFASGDGVVLARAAMVPPGYSVVRGGVVSSERGHVTLLSDLEAVGRCLVAVGRAGRKGVGRGLEEGKGEGEERRIGV